MPEMYALLPRFARILFKEEFSPGLAIDVYLKSGILSLLQGP